MSIANNHSSQLAQLAQWMTWANFNTPWLQLTISMPINWPGWVFKHPETSCPSDAPVTNNSNANCFLVTSNEGVARRAFPLQQTHDICNLKKQHGLCDISDKHSGVFCHFFTIWTANTWRRDSANIYGNDPDSFFGADTPHIGIHNKNDLHTSPPLIIQNFNYLKCMLKKITA